MEDTVKYLVEALGTFFFLSVIMAIGNKNNTGLGNLAPVSVAVALLAAVFFGGYVSGGHFNPAVTVAMILRNRISQDLAVGYIMSQLVGAVLAAKVSGVLESGSLAAMSM